MCANDGHLRIDICVKLVIVVILKVIEFRREAVAVNIACIPKAYFLGCCAYNGRIGTHGAPAIMRLVTVNVNDKPYKRIEQRGNKYFAYHSKGSKPDCAQEFSKSPYIS